LHNENLNYYLAYQEPPPNLFQTMGYEYPQCLGSMLVENDAVIGVGNRFFQKVTNEGVLENYLAFSNDIIGIHQISKDEALAFGGNLIFTLNENGDLDSLLSLPFTVQKKIHVNNELVLLKSTENTYHVIDTTGAILFNFNAELDFSEVLQIIFRDGYFWVLGKNENGLELRKYSESLGYEMAQSIDTLDFKPVSFELWDNHFLLLGYEPDLKNRHLVLKGIEYNQPDVQIDFPDVGIAEMPPAEVTSIYHNYFTYNYAQIKLRIKNFGQETIDSLWVNGKWNGPGIFYYLYPNCYGANISKLYNNLNLTPGQDTLIQFSIQISSYSHMANGSACFWTSLPNGKRDLISENDEACSFEYVLSTTNIDFSETIHIFPNPAKDVLQIQFTAEPKNQLQVQIYDLSGRLVQSESLQRGQELYQIPVSALKTGSYFLQITSDIRVINHKIIIAR